MNFQTVTKTNMQSANSNIVWNVANQKSIRLESYLKLKS